MAIDVDHLAQARPVAPRPTTGPLPAGETAGASSPHLAKVLQGCAYLVWFGLFSFYYKIWIELSELRGLLLRTAQPIADGTGPAPFQYRFAIPELLMFLHRELGWPVGYGQLVVDGFFFTGGVLVLHALLRRLDLGGWILPAALYCSFLGIGIMWWGKFETVPAFAAMTIATVAVVVDTRWRWLLLVVGSVGLAATRTDLLFALAVALLARWFFAGRRRSDLGAACGIGVASVAVTLGLIALFPDARYEEGTAVVQLMHNIRPAVLLTALGFLAPVLGPYLLVRSDPAVRRLLAPHRAIAGPLLALIAAEVASVLVIGRVDEVRLLFPMAAAMAIVGILGWRAVLLAHIDELLPSSSTGRASPPHP